MRKSVLVVTADCVDGVEFRPKRNFELRRKDKGIPCPMRTCKGIGVPFSLPPGVSVRIDPRPQSILERVGISSAPNGLRLPRNRLEWAKQCPRSSSIPGQFPPAH